MTEERKGATGKKTDEKRGERHERNLGDRRERERERGEREARRERKRENAEKRDMPEFENKLFL